MISFFFLKLKAKNKVCVEDVVNYLYINKEAIPFARSLLSDDEVYSLSLEDYDCVSFQLVADYLFN